MLSLPPPVEEKSTLCSQIVRSIESAITSGAFAVGERLPSISRLGEQFGVSRMTIIMALKELKAAGYLESRPRSGFYVCRPANSELPASQRTLVALLVTAMQNTFYAKIVAGAEEECRKAGYRLVVANSKNDPLLEAEHIRELAGQVAGLIIAPVTGAPNYAAYSILLERQVPWVFVDRFIEGLAVPCVATDNVQGGYLATQHLLEMKRRRIYMVSVDGTSTFRERAEGYRKALQEFGVPFDSRLIRSRGDDNHTAGYILTREILEEEKARKQQAPIGLFAVNEEIASGCYLAIREAGFSIPRDVAVVGYDDLSALHLDPPLTTIRQPLTEFGSAAVELLLEAVRPGAGQGRARAGQGIRFEPELIVRNSSDSTSEFSLGQHLIHRSETPEAEPPASAAKSPPVRNRKRKMIAA